MPGTNFSSEEPLVPCDDDDLISIDITWGENDDFTLTLDFVAVSLHKQKQSYFLIHPMCYQNINKTWRLSSLALTYQTDYPGFVDPASKL